MSRVTLHYLELRLREEAMAVKNKKNKSDKKGLPFQGYRGECLNLFSTIDQLLNTGPTRPQLWFAMIS